MKFTSACESKNITITKITKMNVGNIVYRPGISSLKGQGRFHLAKGTSIGKSESLQDNFEGAMRPRLGAPQATGSGLRVIPGLHCSKENKSLSNKHGKTQIESFLYIQQRNLFNKISTAVDPELTQHKLPIIMTAKLF